MNSYSAMAATACQVLNDYVELPEVVGVSIGTETLGTSPAEFRPAIALHLCNAGTTGGVAAWAAAFGAPVRLIRNDDYVQVTTETVRDGYPVVAWNHINIDVADELAARLGKQLDTVLDIDPAHLNAIQA